MFKVYRIRKVMHFVAGKVRLLLHVIFIVLFVFSISVKDKGVLSEVSKLVDDSKLF